MKFFTTAAIALATIAAQSAAEYVCHGDTFFTFDSNASPSKEAQKFLGAIIIDTFNEAYARFNDMHMDAEKNEDVSRVVVISISDSCVQM